MKQPLRWLVAIAGLILFPLPVGAEDPASGNDLLRTLTGLDSDSLAVPLRALLIVTVFGAVPSAVLLTTCFPRVVIVLSFLRRALGTQELPPNLVVTGVALLLTGAVMFPVWTEVYEKAYVPLVESKEISTTEALRNAEEPLKRFMLNHILRSDPNSLRLFVEIAQIELPLGDAEETADDSESQLKDLSFFVVLPAFVLSELKIAFQMGFLIYLPFVLIDLVVSSVLVSMGMFMLPPNLVSLPLKVLVFVLVDGWTLVVGQLAHSIQAV